MERGQTGDVPCSMGFIVRGLVSPDEELELDLFSEGTYVFLSFLFIFF